MRQFMIGPLDYLLSSLFIFLSSSEIQTLYAYVDVQQGYMTRKVMNIHQLLLPFSLFPVTQSPFLVL